MHKYPKFVLFPHNKTENRSKVTKKATSQRAKNQKQVDGRRKFLTLGKEQLVNFPLQKYWIKMHQLIS